MKTILSTLSLLILSTAAATTVEDLPPEKIMERFISAHQTLRFAEVLPYMEPGAVTEFRRTTSAVIAHAVQRFGKEAIVRFFQGTTLEQLQAASDADYWAFVMASAMQFSTEKPIRPALLIGQVSEGPGRLLLVYDASRSLVTAPELGLYGVHVVFAFERREQGWKMITFMATPFEATLHWYLRRVTGS